MPEIPERAEISLQIVLSFSNVEAAAMVVKRILCVLQTEDFPLLEGVLALVRKERIGINAFVFIRQSPSREDRGLIASATAKEYAIVKIQRANMDGLAVASEIAPADAIASPGL